MELKHHAQAYYELGLSVLPVTGKKPAIKSWKQYQATRMEPRELASRFSSPEITGVAVILGQVSGNLCCRDFDRADSYRSWAAKHPECAATLPTARTARGFHVYFRASGETTQVFQDGELRGEHSYTLLPPSIHPDGPIYHWITPLSQPIPSINPVQHGLKQPWTNVTEGQRDGGTEGTEGADGTEVVRVIGATFPKSLSIKSLQDAVNEALPIAAHQNHHSLFKLARAMLALQKFSIAGGELISGESLPIELLRQAFEHWYTVAKTKGCLRPSLSKDDYWLEFLEAWEDVKVPLGEGSMNQFFEAAKKAARPAVALKHFEDPQLLLLCALCRELQRNAGKDPFFLSCRTVQRLFELPQPMSARRWLKGLHAVRILAIEEKGSIQTGKASRFRYLHPLD